MSSIAGGRCWTHSLKAKVMLTATTDMASLAWWWSPNAFGCYICHTGDTSRRLIRSQNAIIYVACWRGSVLWKSYRTESVILLSSSVLWNADLAESVTHANVDGDIAGSGPSATRHRWHGRCSHYSWSVRVRWEGHRKFLIQWLGLSLLGSTLEKDRVTRIHGATQFESIGSMNRVNPI